jgi:hypothetical protein
MLEESPDIYVLRAGVATVPQWRTVRYHSGFEALISLNLYRDE